MTWIGVLMNKRLIWNFEITDKGSLALPSAIEKEDEARWEMRFFWPDENQPIVLHNLSESFLELSRYTIKHRNDCYLILNDRDYNIKIRQSELVYKPKVDVSGDALGYGKKQKYERIDEMTLPKGEPLSLSSFLNKLQREAQTMTVEKEAVIYKFPSSPKIIFELARIKIKDHVFFSVSLESRVLSWVEYLSQRIIGEEQSSIDYVEFLKSVKAQ